MLKYHNQPAHTMVLYVDDRENDILIHKLYARMGNRDFGPNGQVQVKRLQSADYIIGDWGIEAKEINDLYHSILGHGRSRTIVGQLQDLEESFDRPMLVVYGEQLKPFIPGKKMNRKLFAIEKRRMEQTILNFKITFQLRFPNISFMQFGTMDEFVNYLAINHTQKTHVGVSQQTHNAKKTERVHPQVLALSALPGITEEQAEDMLERMGGLRNIMRLRTRQKDLMETKGVGRSRARKILSLRDDYNLDISVTDEPAPE